MTNAQIADSFDQIADILEFQGANPFRVRAYRNSARTIRDYSESLAAIVEERPEALTEIDGIGDDLAKKIIVLVNTSHLPMLEELKNQVPESVLALMRIPGLGPKKAAALHKELNIQSLEQLKAACEAQQVRGLKGFGAKTEQVILQGIALAQTAGQRILWADADALVQALREHLSGCPQIEQLEFAGSYRRGKDTVGDLDILVVSAAVEQVMDRLGSFPQLADVIVRGDTKMSIRTEQHVQVDLRVVPAESFGAALQYFTGSKEHNVVVRGRAKDQGLKINEYGVYRVHDGQDERIAGRTEAEVYATIGLPEFPPELRENRQEFIWAAAGKLPELITLADIRGDLHMHTHATDGAASIMEMVHGAIARGLSYIAITDHSQRVSMARGLDATRVRAQWKEIDELRPELPADFTLLKGIECDILEKGGMDLPDDVLAEADWVLASVHYGQKQPRQEITERIFEQVYHILDPVDIGQSRGDVNRREPYDVDLDAVFATAKKQRKFLELNANPYRLDLNDVYCSAAKQQGIPLVIDTDAHSVDGLAVMRYGILQARRGGLMKGDIANTRSWKDLQKLRG